MPSSLSSNLTVKQAAAALAKHAAAVRARATIKRAFDPSSLWSNPYVRGGLLGAGAGAVGGLGLSALGDREKRHPMRDALTGALAGGAVGVGLPLFSQMGEQLAAKTPDQKELDRVKAVSGALQPGPVASQVRGLPGELGSVIKEHPALSGAAGAPAAYLAQDWWRRRGGIDPSKINDPEVFKRAVRDFGHEAGITPSSAADLGRASPQDVRNILTDIRGGKMWSGDMTAGTGGAGINQHNLDDMLRRTVKTMQEESGHAPIAGGWRSMIPGIAQNELKFNKPAPGAFMRGASKYLPLGMLGMGYLANHDASSGLKDVPWQRLGMNSMTPEQARAWLDKQPAWAQHVGAQ